MSKVSFEEAQLEGTQMEGMHWSDTWSPKWPEAFNPPRTREGVSDAATGYKEVYVSSPQSFDPGRK